MLRLILGRAKSGKTGFVMDELRLRTERGQGGAVLLVPEQYSHEAETELLTVCGDSLSLYAEVLSFTRLWERVAEETGCAGGRRLLDAGGRLLCLTRGLDAVGSRLTVFSSARRQLPLQQALLAAVDECRISSVSPDRLRQMAVPDGLREKLADLSLVYEAYNAVAGSSGLDQTERLTLLAEALPRSSYARQTFYIDGFTDFTAREEGVIAALLEAGADVTVCLTSGGRGEDAPMFAPSRRAAERLRRLAEARGASCSELYREKEERPGAMAFLERELFAFDSVRAEDTGAVVLLRAGSIAEECEAAAARCLELVRETGCRWRDVAVAARDFEVYRTMLETVFHHYGVPLYAAAKSDVLSRPLPAMIDAGISAVTGGWDYDSLFDYLRTGLGGLTGPECDTLEDYAFLWSLRGNRFSEDKDWTLHPDGFSKESNEESGARLAEINALRRRALGPLWVLAKAAGRESTAAGQAAAVAAWFDALALPERLEARAGELRAEGMERTAAEYVQLWDIAVEALEQASAVLGDTEMDLETFGKLYLLTLSAHDVGTIPLSLDRVGAGDMGRMRRRKIRHLIVLGCDSETLPLSGGVPGILTDEDRETLYAAGLELGDTADRRLEREYALLYNCLTLPSETLTMSYCMAAGEGGKALPAFVMTRAGHLLGRRIRPVSREDCRAAAPEPALELAAEALAGRTDGVRADALRYARERGNGDALAELEQAASLGRGRLSPAAVRALYGEKPRLSASRADSLSACGFSYFLRYGLRAKPRLPAEFSPPELGSFMHYVLEGVARTLREEGTVTAAAPERVRALCREFMDRYIREMLADFRQQSPRFEHLFRRLAGDVQTVVEDMLEELGRGDFQPLDFELDFGDRSQFPPIPLEEGEEALTLSGVADRVDGWLHDGKLYLRVVDYKTGHKSFSLSDVWYGMGLQMLLYLFALERTGRRHYKEEVVPAGVLYIPARDVLISAKAPLSPEEIVAEKARARRRSGLLLDDKAVLEAMEHGETPRYLPVSYNKSGAAAGDALASAERLGILSRRVDETLRSLAAELRSGSIQASPWFRSQSENACLFCDYREACHFDEQRDQIRYQSKCRTPQVWEKLEQWDREKQRER